MATHLETRLEIKSWDEKAHRELGDGRTFARADVALAQADDGVEVQASFESLLYYHADGTSAFGSLMHLQGRIGEQTGSFAMQGGGTYDGTTAHVEFDVIPGSGTGDFTDVTGTATSISTHGDYPFMPLTFRIETP